MEEDRKAKLDSLLMEAMNAETSKAGKNLFKELADFEQGHYDRLKRMIETRNKGLKIEAETEVKEIPAKSEVEGEFEPNKDEITKVISIGIEAEKKAQAKYLEIANMFEDIDSKTIFSNMAEEERKHQKILEDQFFHMSNKGTIIWGD
jgi:hypothetical protein